MSRFQDVLVELRKQMVRAPLLSVVLIVTLALGCVFRFLYIDAIYTECDDIGVIGVYKTVTPGDRVRQVVSTSVLKVDATFSSEAFGNTLLDSPIFPVYIAKQWTYPIGQYLIYPLLIAEADSYEKKVAIARGVSAFASCLALVLFCYLLFRLEGNSFTWRVVLPVCLLAFSLNTNLYAHHMSPYSMTVATVVLAMIQFHRVMQQRLSLGWFGLWLGILTNFNYLILITIPVFALLIFYRFSWHRNLLLRFGEWWRPVARCALAYVLVAGPSLLLFFRPGAGTRGEMPPAIGDGVFSYLSHFVRAIVFSAGSTLASFCLNDSVNALFAGVVLVGGTAVLFYYRKCWTNEQFVAAFAGLFILEWVVLHGLHKILLGPSRHVLVWLPLLGVLLHLCLVTLNVKRWILAAASVGIIVSGSQLNDSILRSKFNQFDFAAIEKIDTDVVLSYECTFAPAVYFQGRKRCWVVDHRCFADDYEKLGLPDRIALVSQEYSFEDYARTEKFKANWRLFRDYEVHVVRELPSKTSFTFNNQGNYSSNPNGFFLYELRRRNLSEVAERPEKRTL